jgi:hypothetical protein
LAKEFPERLYPYGLLVPCEGAFHAADLAPCDDKAFGR